MAGKEKEAAAKPEATPEGAGEKKKGLPMKAIIVAVAVVVLEVATVGVTVMMSGGPKKVMADPAVTTAPASEPAKEKEAEVKLMDGKLPNRKMGAGRLYLFDMSVVAKVKEADKEKVKALIEEMDAEIKDKIRTIVASSGAESLDEPGLETLRRQIKYQLEHDLGKDTIKEILIPKCIPNRQD